MPLRRHTTSWGSGNWLFTGRDVGDILLGRSVRGGLIQMSEMSEKQLEDWQEFGRDVANLRAKLLELEGSEAHKERIGKNLDSLSRMVEAAARELRSEDRAREA